MNQEQTKAEPYLCPVKAIREYCQEECTELIVEGYGFRQYRISTWDCPHEDDCPLYPYRMGHNPRRKGIAGRPQRRMA